MRLDEWQRLLESEFVEERAAKAGAIISVEIQPPLFDAADAGGQTEHSATVPADLVGSTAGMGTVPDVPYNGAVPASAPLQDRGPATEVEHTAPTAVPTSEVQVSAPPGPIRHIDRAATMQAVSATDDIMVAPFADYITARLAGSEQAPAPDLQDPRAAQEGVTMGNGLTGAGVEWPGSSAAEREMSGQLIHVRPYPLTVSSRRLARLHQEGDSAAVQDLALSQRREALTRRLLDPVLSLDETALLLGITTQVVRQYADRDALESCEPPGANNSLERETNRETSPLNFRLSDIVAFLETKAAATGTTGGAGQDGASKAE